MACAQNSDEPGPGRVVAERDPRAGLAVIAPAGLAAARVNGADCMPGVLGRRRWRAGQTAVLTARRDGRARTHRSLGDPDGIQRACGCDSVDGSTSLCIRSWSRVTRPQCQAAYANSSIRRPATSRLCRPSYPDRCRASRIATEQEVRAARPAPARPPPSWRRCRAARKDAALRRDGRRARGRDRRVLAANGRDVAAGREAGCPRRCSTGSRWTPTVSLRWRRGCATSPRCPIRSARCCAVTPSPTAWRSASCAFRSASSR